MTEHEPTRSEEAEPLEDRLKRALDDFRANGPASRDSVAAIIEKHDRLHAEQKAELEAKNEATQRARY